MPLFYFILKNGLNAVPDREGVELPNETAANSHADTIARELMRNQETKTRAWRLEVCNEDLRPIFELSFAQVDGSLSHLPAESRQAIQNVCRSIGSLADSINDVRTTLAQIEATIGRANELIEHSPLHRTRAS